MSHGTKADTKSKITVELILLLFTCFVFAIMFIFTNFKTKPGILSYLKEVAYLLPCSLGMTMIILTGNIDISAGTMMGLCGYLAAYISKRGCDFYIYIPAAILLGMSLSCINAFIITKFKVPAMVATLAMMNVEMGSFILLPQGGWVENVTENFTFLGTKNIGGIIPYSFLIAVAVTIVMLVFMKYSRFSRNIYAIGGNKSIAILSGISYNRTIYKTYLIHGALIGFGSILFYTPKGVVQANSAYGMEMLFITATVVGGVSIAGGKGKAIGTVIGVFLVSLMNRAIIFFGLQDYYTYALQGVIILIAVLLSDKDGSRRRRIRTAEPTVHIER